MEQGCHTEMAASDTAIMTQPFLIVCWSKDILGKCSMLWVIWPIVGGITIIRSVCAVMSSPTARQIHLRHRTPGLPIRERMEEPPPGSASI